MKKNKEKEAIKKARMELKNLGIDVSSYSDEEIKELVIKISKIIVDCFKDFRESLNKAMHPIIKSMKSLFDKQNEIYTKEKRKK